jgi:hypothetical protein
MMPDNWGFVIAAYGLAAVVLVAYWRFLSRHEKLLDDARAVRHDLRRGPSGHPRPERPSRGLSP